MVKQTDITAYRLDGTAVTSESRVESSFEYNAVDALVRAQVSDLAGTWVREFGYRGAHMTSVTESPAEADLAVAASSEDSAHMRLFVMIWVVLAVWIRLLVWSCTLH